jgi:hypothetical protein
LEVSYTSSRSGGSAKARVSRSSAITSKKIIIRHRPTGETVSGEIEPGHYTRKKMQALTAELEEELLTKLEKAVVSRPKT